MTFVRTEDVSGALSGTDWMIFGAWRNTRIQGTSFRHENFKMVIAEP